MKGGEYWRRRFAQLEAAQNAIGADTMKDIERQYQRARRQIEGQIAAWYRRFADNNNITLAEARKWLAGKDLKEFKWDVQEYVKYGEENAVDGQWMKELENASAKWHISRLEALKAHVRQSLEEMFAKQGRTAAKALGNVYQSGYYHTAYELQKGFSIGFDIAAVDRAQVEKVLAKPWASDGYNFSERIWRNKNKLIREVHAELSRNVMLGADPQKAIDAIAKKMNTSKHNAGRLVMTEEAYFSSLAQEDCFKDLGVEQYEVVATLDSHTSEICRGMDGRVFPMGDYQPGETAPPFHVYCRSTTVPHFDDDFGQIGERAAKDENEKTYYVPADMTYKDWEKAFVDGGSKEGLQEIKKFAKTGMDGHKLSMASHEVDWCKALRYKNLAKPIDAMYIISENKVETFNTQEIIDEMGKSPIGQKVLSWIEDSDVRILLKEDEDGNGNRGDQVEKFINLYPQNIKSVRVAAQTIIHEMTHYHYDIGCCQHAEAICFGMEKLHLTGKEKLTKDEWEYVKKLAIDNYPELNWEGGDDKNYEGIKIIDESTIERGTSDL